MKCQTWNRIPNKAEAIQELSCSQQQRSFARYQLCIVYLRFAALFERWLSVTKLILTILLMKSAPFRTQDAHTDVFVCPHLNHAII